MWNFETSLKLKESKRPTMEPDTNYPPLLSPKSFGNMHHQRNHRYFHRKQPRNKSVHLNMLNMSKAYNRISRNKLIEDLQNTMEADQLHIIYKLLNVSLCATCENTLSEVFETGTGAPQRDCASALDFTYYLAKSLDPVKSNQPLDHSCVEQTIRSNIADHLTENTYCIVIQKVQTNIRYADYISKLTSNNSSKHYITEVLESRNLVVNKDKFR